MTEGVLAGTARARRRCGGRQIEAERRVARRAHYDQVREQIQTGDLVFFRGRGPLSRLIRKLSGCVYSHVGITWWEGHLVVFHARLPIGVEVLPARRLVWRYDGQVDWWTLRLEHANRLDRGRLLSVAIAELGKSYSFRGLVGAGLRLLAGRISGRCDPVGLPETYFCSQFVSACFRGGGVDLAPDEADACTSPGSIVRAGQVEMRAVLRRPR